MSESHVIVRARSNPLSYRSVVMATHVTVIHVEALLPWAPLGDSQIFNVQASIKLFPGVLYSAQMAGCLPSEVRKLDLNSANLSQMHTDLEDKEGTLSRQQISCFISFSF